MQHDITTQAAAVFVCHSKVDLQTACDHIQAQYHLPAFRFDEHSRWEYARAISRQLGFIITKTQRLDEIAQWMEGIPENVNYQIILYLDHTNTTSADTTNGAHVMVEDVYAFLKDVFATPVVWVKQHRAGAHSPLCVPNV